MFSDADKKLGAALFSTYFKPLLKPNEHNLGCGDETLLIAFADGSDFLIGKVNVGNLQAGQFVASKSASYTQTYDCNVTERAGVGTIRTSRDQL